MAAKNPARPPAAPIAACLTAGLGSSLGFGHLQGPGWLIPILALAVLFQAAGAAGPRRAAWLGLAFGAGHFGLGVSWTHISMHVHGNLPLPGAIALSLLLALLLASFYALAAGLGRFAAHSEASAARRLLLLAAAWAVCEHARGWMFSGFGWLAAGYSQVPHGPYAGYLPVIGTFGVTALCAVTASLLALAVRQRDMVRIAVPAVAVAALGGVGLLLSGVQYTNASRPAFAASILQGAVPQERQWIRDNIRTLPALYLALASQAEGDLLVTPEGAFPFYWRELEEETLQPYFDLLADGDRVLIAGSFTEDEDSGLASNSAVILEAGGRERHYAKRQLTPYGEYLPFSELLEPLLERAQIPYSNQAAGTGTGVVELPYARIGLSICYESLFPRLFEAPPAEVLVNITNDSWFDGTAMAAQHIQIVAARAAEFQRWMVRASNSGVSAFIRPDGTVAHSIASGERAVATHEVEPREGATPYARFGDYPVLALALLVLLAGRVRFGAAS